MILRIKGNEDVILKVLILLATLETKVLKIVYFLDELYCSRFKKIFSSWDTVSAYIKVMFL